MKITTQNYGEIALIPNQAQAPMKEILEFLTEVREAYDGTEERTKLRNMARQTIIQRVPVQSKQWASVFVAVYKALRNKVAIPLWSEVQFLGDVAEGATSLACNTDDYDLRSDGLALLFDACGNSQVAQIGTKSSGLLSLLAPLEAMTAASMIPLRVGKMLGDLKYQTDGARSTADVVYQTDDLAEVASSAPTQYLSHDSYTEESLLSGSDTNRSFSKRQEIFDGSLGIIATRTSWSNSQLEVAHRKLLEGASETNVFKSFLYRRAGRYRDFWLPSFESNVRLKHTGALTTTVNVWKDSLLDFQPMRSNVAFQTKAGVWLNRVISAYAEIDETTVQLTLNTSLAVDAAEVLRCSYLGLYRMNADRVELNWIGQNICEVETSFLELSP